MHRDGHIEVKRSYYAVPPEYLGREVWVRWDARVVRIFNERMQQIAFHAKQELGRFSSPPEYIAAEKISGVDAARVALAQGRHSTGPAERRLGRGDGQGPRCRGDASAHWPLEPCRPPFHLGD